MTSTHSAIRIRLRYFLRGRLRIDGRTSRVLVRLDQWAATVIAEGFDAAIAKIPGAKTSESVPDMIREIADYLAKNVNGLEGDVLRKSLQETLFFTLGTRSNHVGSRLHGPLTAFLRRGGSGLLRRFLRLHLFNLVWLETSESFRAVAQTQSSFVQDMESVERLCQRVVDSAWRSQKIRGKLDRSSARELIDRVQELINS